MEPITPRFTTVLAVRDTSGRPSDLEFLFRSHCRKLRVVQHLAGDAHLVVPKVAGLTTSLGIRVYYGHETCTHSSIQNFFETYQMAVIFVIASSTSSRNDNGGSTNPSSSTTMTFVLNDPSSLFHRAQQLAGHARVRYTSEYGTTKEKLARAYLVQTAEAALSILLTLEADLHKEEIRHRYYTRQCVTYFIPPYQHPQQPQAASVHVAEALRRWGNRYEIPPFDINILMSVLGSLAAIASGNGLDTVPVEDRTKKLVRAFFGIPEPFDHQNFRTPPPAGGAARHEPPPPLGSYPMQAWNSQSMMVSPFAGFTPTYIAGRDPPIVGHTMPRAQHQQHHEDSFNPYSVHYDPSYDPPLVQHSLPSSRRQLTSPSTYNDSGGPPHQQYMFRRPQDGPLTILGGNRDGR